MAVLPRLGNPALLTAQKRHQVTASARLTLAALVVGIPLEKVNQYAASAPISLAAQTKDK